MVAMAKLAGARFPEVVAAQCVLESGWFKHETGAYNIVGAKAEGNEPYSTCTTWEHYDGKDVTIQAKFKDYDSYQDCINELVERWYLDYQGVTKESTAPPQWVSAVNLLGFRRRLCNGSSLCIEANEDHQPADLVAFEILDPVGQSCDEVLGSRS